jgi:hypothetical protein
MTSRRPMKTTSAIGHFCLSGLPSTSGRSWRVSPVPRGRSGTAAQGRKPGPAEGVRLLRATRQSRFSVRSYTGRKTSRRDIVIGRPALSLKAWPPTHDTISHLYGVDDGEALPVA